MVFPHGLHHLLLLFSVLDDTVDWLAKYHFLRPPRRNVLEFRARLGAVQLLGLLPNMVNTVCEHSSHA